MSTTYYITTSVNEEGNHAIMDGPDGSLVPAPRTIARDISTLEEACKIIMAHVIPGVRGPGCFGLYETGGKDVWLHARYERGLLGGP